MKLIQKLLFTILLVVFLLIQLGRTVNHLVEGAKFDTKEILVNQFIQESVILNTIVLLVIIFYIASLSFNIYKQINKINSYRYNRLERDRTNKKQEITELTLDRSSRPNNKIDEPVGRIYESNEAREIDIFYGLKKYFKEINTLFS